MLSRAPIVSIITPSFNQAGFLTETLRSVADQDYAHVEHVVMDGGSTDGSIEIITDWARGHPILWSCKPDAGQADAILQGVERSRGEIVAWLNSDDIYLDRSVITEVVRVFLQGAQIVTGGGWFIDENGRRLRRIPVERARLTHESLRHVDTVLQPATFVLRDLFVGTPLDRSLTYAFDWDLFIRLSAKAEFTPIERDIAGYRLHRRGKTVSGGSRRQRELLEVVRRYHGRRSRAYLLLLPIVTAHRIAERLPFGLYRWVASVLSRIARMTQMLSSGRGIQN